MAVMTMIEAIQHTLKAEMERDERVLVMGQDVGVLGGVFRGTQGLLDQFGSERVVDMPLAEAAIVGAAVGLACSGLVPVAEIQFFGFGHQAFHQISDQAACYRLRSQGRFGMPLTIRTPFGGGVRTPELHSAAIENKFVQSPGLKIVMPATAADAKGLLTASIRDPDPVLFCEPLRGYRLIKGEVPEGEHVVELGKARLARPGSDVTLIAWSAAVVLAERAAEAAAAEGIDCAVLDLRTLVPLDTEAIAEAVSRTGRAVVVHEAPLTGGFGAEVVATIQENVFYSLCAPIQRVAAYDTPYPMAGTEDLYLPDVDRVLAGIRRAVSD